MSIYEEWMRADAELKQAKQKEISLRNEICDMVLEDKLEGSLTIRDYGVKITATARLNRSLDRATLEAIWSDLTDEEKECIVYKPELKLSAWKKLEGTGSLLDEVITVKPAQSSLKIIGE